MKIYAINFNIISLIGLGLLIYFSHKNRRQKVARSFLFALLCMLFWGVASTLELLSDSFHRILLFRNLAQIGMAYASLMNYWFVLVYAELEENRSFKIIFWVFFLLNTLGILLLFTDPMHHLMRLSVDLNTVGTDLVLVVKPTLLGSFFVIIRFLLFGFATILLFRFASDTFQNTRKQVAMIGFGFLLALILTLLKQYWLKENGVTITMSSILVLPYVFIGIGIFRFNFLSVSPVAKEWVFNALNVSIVVFSKEGEMIEFNDSARRFIDQYASQIDLEQYARALKGSEDFRHELCFESLSGPVYYEIHLHHLLSPGGRKQGSVAAVRDITTQVNRQHVLIEKADYDGLTRVLNKTAFEREYTRITKMPVSLLIIDVDNFKKINDTYGHPVGDAVLVGLTRAMKSSIRKQDLMGRLGGDEFSVILTNCGRSLCRCITERVIENVKAQHYDVDVTLGRVSVSIGAKSDIDIRSTSYSKAYAAADAALYHAKKGGRNRVVIH